jgi:hypothetical protein
MIGPSSACWCLLIGVLLVAMPAMAAQLEVDETPGEPGTWGFRPADGEISQRNPPPFSWRPQEAATHYRLQVAADEAFQRLLYEADDIVFNVHCPSETLPAGPIFWRFGYRDADGNQSAWSRVRRVTIPDDAVDFPLPARDQLLGRIPSDHPRLFIRPEDLPRLRELAQGELKPIYDQLVEKCDKLLAEPPPTEEPQLYPEGTVRLSEEWRAIWWGNRTYTIAVLDGAANLGFLYHLSGEEKYGQEARRLILEAAKWDPLGATGYRYNDEAGMPFAKYFSRAYTFTHELLTEEERQICRDVMRIRGQEMYDHLHPRHLWRPFGSHSNRAWHFLGEIGVAFKDEIPEADDWTWFAMNVFANVYPVWSDSDGGWHEGVAYWRSYLARFTWWADIMRAAMDIDAFQLPFFSQAGYYAMYLQPPNTYGGGFGDQTLHDRSNRNAGLMAIFAAQAQNPHWQWYVEALGGHQPEVSYVGFIRGAVPAVEPEEPTDLPTSRRFAGTGQAFLNTTLLNSADNVQLLFKSSPMGSISHGYDAQNSFTLTAYGQQLFRNSGHRDIHGSEHHTQWMWQTKSTNSILVSGEGQTPRTAAPVGQITGFHTSEHLDFVSGEAGDAYGERLDRFERQIIFIKPSLIVIVDRLEAPSAETFQWLLHSMTPFQISNQQQIHVENEKASCLVAIHVPDALEVTQTDQFDPPPRERVQLTQHHLTASTSAPARNMMFISTLRPYRAGSERPADVEVEQVEGGYVLRAQMQDGEAVVLIRNDGTDRITAGGFDTTAPVLAVRLATDGSEIGRFECASD